jgi:hypothetical protein
MKSEKLNSWLALGANIGVLIGILLLVYELNQNREMTAAQIRNEAAASRINIALSRANNGELADIVFRAQFVGEEMTPVERSRYEAWAGANFRDWENVSYQHRQGLLDDSEYSALRDVWLRLLRGNDVVREAWCKQTWAYSEPFVDEIYGRKQPLGC